MADGINWSPDQKVGETIKIAPAIAAYNGELVLAYVADNGTNDLLVTTSTDGTNWTPDQTVGDQASATAPAISS